MIPEQRKELIELIKAVETTAKGTMTISLDWEKKETATLLNQAAWHVLYNTLNKIASRSTAYDEFYTDVSCLFAEGVEFMDKIQLYNAFKEGFLKLQEKLK